MSQLEAFVKSKKSQREAQGLDPAQYIELLTQSTYQKQAEEAKPKTSWWKKVISVLTSGETGDAVYQMLDGKNPVTEYGKSVIEGLQGQGYDRKTYADVLERLGFPNKRISDLFPGLYSETGEGVKLRKEGFLDPSSRGTIGLTADILLDPVTYLGGAGLFKRMGIKGSKLTDEGLKVYERSQNMIKNIDKRQGLTDESLKTIATINEKMGTILKSDPDKYFKGVTFMGQDLIPRRIALAPGRFIDNFMQHVPVLGNVYTGAKAGVQDLFKYGADVIRKGKEVGQVGQETAEKYLQMQQQMFKRSREVGDDIFSEVSKALKQFEKGVPKAEREATLDYIRNKVEIGFADFGVKGVDRQLADNLVAIMEKHAKTFYRTEAEALEGLSKQMYGEISNYLPHLLTDEAKKALRSASANKFIPRGYKEFVTQPGKSREWFKLVNTKTGETVIGSPKKLGFVPFRKQTEIAYLTDKANSIITRKNNEVKWVMREINKLDKKALRETLKDTGTETAQKVATLKVTPTGTKKLVPIGETKQGLRILRESFTQKPKFQLRTAETKGNETLKFIETMINLPKPAVQKLRKKIETRANWVDELMNDITKITDDLENEINSLPALKQWYVKPGKAQKYEAGITSVKGTKPIKADKLVDEAKTLEEAGNFSSAKAKYNQALKESEGIKKIVDEFKDTKGVKINEIKPSLGRFFKETEPTVYNSFTVDPNNVDDFIEKMVKLADDDFSQRSLILDNLTNEKTFGIIDANKGLSIEPAYTLKFTRELQLNDIKELDDLIGKYDFLAGGTYAPDLKSIKILNLSKFNTNYDGFIKARDEIVQSLQRRGLLGGVEDSIREVRHFGKTADDALTTYEQVRSGIKTAGERAQTGDVFRIERHASIDEINKELQSFMDGTGFKGKKFFMTDPFEITYQRGSKSAKNIAVAEFYKDVSTKLGKQGQKVTEYVRNPETRKLTKKEKVVGFVDEQTGIKYVDPKIAELPEGTVLPDFIVRDMKKVKEFVDDENVMNKILSAYDKVLLEWKGSVYGWYPASHGRNLIGGIFNNWLAGLIPGDKRYFMAKAIAQGKNGFITTDAGLKISYQEINKQLRRLGVLGQTGYLDVNELRRAFHPSMGRRLKDIPMKAMEMVENELRIPLFVKELERTNSFNQAAKTVFKYHFDYSPEALTKFERNVMKRIIPFYRWTRGNIPLMMEEFIAQPGKMIGLFRSLREMQDDNGNIEMDLLPSYIEKQFAISRGGQTMTGTGLPPIEMLKWMREPIDEFEQGLTPAIKIPAELRFNFSTFKDMSVMEDVSGNFASSYPESLKKWLQYEKKTVTKKDGTTYDIERVDPMRKYWLYALPTARLASLASRVMGEQEKNKLLNAISGLSTFEFDMEQLRQSQEKKYEKTLIEILTNAGLFGQIEYPFADTKEAAGIQAKPKTKSKNPLLQ